MRILSVFARAYPRQTLVMLVCLLLAAVAEGIGLSSLLPLLSLTAQAATDGNANPDSLAGKGGLAQAVSHVLVGVGLQPSIGLLLLIIVAGMTLKAGFILLAQKQIGYTVAQVATDLRLALIRALLTARWEYYIRQPVGSLANAFATEASRAAQAYLYGATILTLLVEALLYTSLALTVSWQATLAAIGIGALIAYALNRLVRMSRRAGARQTRLLKAVLAQLTDVLYAVKPLKAMAREALIGPLLEGETQRLNRAFQREILSKETLRALQEPLVVAALAGGLYIALIRWALPLHSLILLAVLFGNLLNSLNRVQKQYQQLVSYESTFWSIRATIEHSEREHEIIHGKKRPRLKSAIRLDQVTFSYGDQAVLHEVSLTLRVGQVTALIGPSGAGKTSVADLLVGLVRPQVGEVWIDNLPLSAVDLQGWRQMVGYVPQETFLLHESVLVNVTLGDPDLTIADVESALQAAGAWEFVAVLPEGLHTPVGERGARFSGGQRQRIAIARALVHKPQFLILDEATASLDPVTEAAVCATIQQLRGDMTILAISHQPALLQVADTVYHLEGGTMRQLDRLISQPSASAIAT
ncbi:MAG: ABC transporter ATP-binding protein [Deltaproteobacteria bacterium]|nr:ABC transporter ATP-binding protein [Deltaproteobacteria bacterium]